jgi:hypothetical protein
MRILRQRATGGALVCACAMVLLLAMAGTALATGSVRWSKTCRAAAGESAWWSHVVVSGSGAVTVAGSGTGAPSHHEDVWVARYSYGGARTWLRAWDDRVHRRDVATGLAMDAHGNAYVCADTRVGTGTAEILKYSSAGRLVWRHAFQISKGYRTVPSGVAVDGRGRVYVAGFCSGASGLNTAFVTRWSAAGARGWTARYGLPGVNTYSEALAGDGSGATYVAVATYTPSAPDTCVTVKFSSRGRTLWAQEVASATEGVRPNAIAVRGGTVAVVGTAYDTVLAGAKQGFVSGYTSGGAVLFSDVRWISPTASSTDFRDVCLDAWGRVHVAGSFNVSTSERGAMTICYDGSGFWLWDVPVAFAGASIDSYHVVAGTGGRSYVAGMDGRYVFALDVDQYGTALWLPELAPAGTGGSSVSGLTEWRDSAVFVAGSVGRADGSTRARLTRITP